MTYTRSTKASMKFSIALPLLLSCSCFTTAEGHEIEWESSGKNPELKNDIEYEKRLSVGEASRFSILGGFLEFGPSGQIVFLWFLRFGSAHTLYDGEGDSIMSIKGLSNAVVGFIEGNSLAGAAAYDALHPDYDSIGSTRYHVLRSPMYRSEVSNFLLFKNEVVTVEGFRGKLTSSETSWEDSAEETPAEEAPAEEAPAEETPAEEAPAEEAPAEEAPAEEAPAEEETAALLRAISNPTV